MFHLLRWLPRSLRNAKRSARRPAVARPLDRAQLMVEMLEERLAPVAQTITGTVFQDFYDNGTFQTAPATINNATAGTVGIAVDPGVANVMVNVTGNDGFSGTATTNAAGFYTITDSSGTASGATIYQVEFTSLPTGLSEGPNGPNSKSGVQLITGGQANVDLGVVQTLDQVTVNLAANDPELVIDKSIKGNYNATLGITSIVKGVVLGNTVLTVTTSAVHNFSVGDTVVISGVVAPPDNGTFTITAINGPPSTTFSFIDNTPGTATEASGGTAQDTTVANTPVIQDIPYSAGTTSTDATDAHYATGVGGQISVPLKDVGAVSALAWDGLTTLGGVNGTIYAAATDKMFEGFGPNGTGAIYMVSPGTGTTATLFADLNTIFGANTAGPDLHNPINALDDSITAVWPTVGADSLGAMTVSADGTRLYVMDLYNRTLYALGINPDGSYSGVHYAVQIPNITSGGGGLAWQATVTGTNPAFNIQSAAFAGTTVTITTTTANTLTAGETMQITGFTGAAAGDNGTWIITSVNAAAHTFTYTDAAGAAGGAGAMVLADNLGDLRAYAVEEYNGQIYVGVENTAESTQSTADMYAYVFTATDNEAGQTLTFNNTPVPLVGGAQTFFALNYTRGAGDGGATTNDLANWQPWSPTPVTLEGAGNATIPGKGFGGNGEFYPQPEFTGLAFDTNGNMDLAFRDLTGDQTDNVGGPTFLNGLNSYAVTAGETLFAGLKSAGAWDIENNGSVTTTSGVITSGGANQTKTTVATTNASEGAGNIVTITAVNSFHAGETVTIAGYTGGAVNYNGNYEILSATATQFTYRDPNAGLPTTGAAATATVYFDGPQGPGGGHFYWQPYYDERQSNHSHTGQGSLVQLPGYPDVVTTAEDPAIGATGGTSAGGLSWYYNALAPANEIGQNDKAFQLYQNGNNAVDFGKANGTGDLIALLTPDVEIGNRVWLDSNGDGKQEVGESGIAGVTVTLFDVTANATVGSTTTDGQGDYLFNDSNGSMFAGKLLLPNHQYKVEIDTSSTGANKVVLAGLIATAANQGADNEINSKGIFDSTNNIDFITTSISGSVPVDHTLDFGFFTPPTLSTTPNPTTVTLGTSSVTLNDTATFTGTLPPGSITFTLVSPGNVTVYTDTEAIVSGTTTYHTTDVSGSNAGGYTLLMNGTTVVGTYQWNATYTVAGSGTTVTDNGNANEQVVVSPASPSINTTQQPASATVGTSIADKATVTGYDPTGTVTFKLYNNSNGTGVPLFTDANEALVGGVATSTGYTATATGTVYWVATYNGDSNNNAVTSGTALEPVTINPATPSINTTQQPASATVGSSIADKATVSGGDNPTGTVTFNLYNNPNGTGPALFTDANEALVAGVATSTGYTATATGTVYWVATYNGDSNNSAVTSGTALEPVTINPATPSINTAQQPASATVGTSIADKATVSGGDNPSGTVTFNLYNNANGTGPALFTSTVGLVAGVATSAGYTATATGTDYWVATYNGDSNNNVVTSGTALEPVTINPATPSINTAQQPASATVGSSIADQATVSGGFNPSGTVTFKLYNNPNGTGAALFTDANEALVAGVATSTGYTATALGTVYWVATYNGDSNNNAVTSGTALEPVTISKASPTVTTTASITSGGAIGTATSTDSAMLAGGYQESGNLVFTLTAPNNTVVYTHTVTPNGDGTYSSGASGALTQLGTYTWTVSFAGDSLNNSANDQGGPNEQVTVVKASPTINTTQQPASATVGTSIADKATVSGGDNPSGTVTFVLYNNPNGTGPALFTDANEALVAGVATSTGYTATATGTVYWVATYNGDSNNNAVTSGTALEPVTISKASPSINTTQQPASATVGTSIADKATVSGGDNPTGTVTFVLYNNPNGTGPALFTDTNEALVGGVATSVGYTATATGTVYWVATYNGDANNNAVTSGTALEPVTINPATPSINTTQQPASATVGSSIADKATVSGGFNPTGTVTFKLYNNPNGTGVALFTDANEALVGGVATSVGYTATATGTVYWVATYNGDSNNSAVTSGTALEPVTINPATPAINTQQQPASATVGTSIADKATVSGGFNPSGTVTFNLYNNPNGTGTALFTDANEALVAGVATSVGYTATATGTVYWVATYNGDANNNAVTSGTALEPVTINPATPLINTQQQPASATVGTSIADKATVSGGFNPSGTVTFNLYNNPNGTGAALFTDANEALVGGVATSTGYTSTATGTVYWVATYNGDSNNNAVTSGTALEPVTINPATPAINTQQQPASATVGTSIADKATVSGGFNPTGTVTFNLYNNPNGAGPALFTDANEALVAGVATSTGYTATATGTVYWVATYNGDSNNNAVISGTALEPVSINPASPTITTTASITASGAINVATSSDSAVVAGGFNETGNLVFTLTAPDTTVVFTQTIGINGNGTYITNASPMLVQIGTYTWTVTYAGDVNNNAAHDQGGPQEQATTAGLMLGNFVFNDVNNDGIFDGGDSGVPNVSVTLLDAGGNVLATTTTDSTGHYLFTDLIPGTYQVCITPPAGYVSSTGINGSATGPFEPGVSGNQDNEDHGTTMANGTICAVQVTLGPPGSAQNPDNGGLANLRQDFGIFQAIGIGNLIFNDLTNSGIASGSSPGIGNVVVDLVDANGNLVAATTSNSQGGYLFSYLTPGSYRVLIPSANFAPGGALFGFSSSTGLPGSLTGPFEPAPNNNIDNQDKGTIVGTLGSGGFVEGGVITLAVGQEPTGETPTRGIAAIGLDPNTNLTQDFGFFAESNLTASLGRVDLNLQKTVSASIVLLPDLVTFTFVINNGGPDTATNVKVSDPFPNGLVFVSATTPSQGSYDPTTGIWYVGTLAVGARATLTVTAQVFVAGVMMNTAIASSDQLDPTLTNNMSSAGVMVQLPPSQAGKTPLLTPGAPALAAIMPTSMPAALTSSEALIAVGAGAGNLPMVEVFDRRTGAMLFSFMPFPSSFRGGVHVALGDVNGDGMPDIIVGAGAGGSPEVEVFDGRTGKLLTSFYAMTPTFTGGVNVAAGDIAGAGYADIVVAAGAGGGPEVEVYDGRSFQMISSFYAMPSTFTGGVNIAVGDVFGTGFADIVAAAGAGGGPQVTVFDGRTLQMLQSFYAMAPTFTGGVNLALGDVNGDGRLDIITGAGAGGGPQVSIFDGKTLQELGSFFAFPASFTGGVTVASADETGTGLAAVVVGAGSGGEPAVLAFSSSGQELDAFFAYDPAFLGGVFVAATRRG